MLLEKEQEIIDLFNEYLQGNISKTEFDSTYKKLSYTLDSTLETGLYHPLDVISTSHLPQEKAWKENLIQTYTKQIKKLEIEIDKINVELDNYSSSIEDNFSLQISEELQKELCKDALEFIPIAAKDRSTKYWIEHHLIKHGQLKTFNAHGQSYFGSHSVIFESELLHQSLLLTVLSGLASDQTLDYMALVNYLKLKEETTWLFVTELDKLCRVEHAPWYYDPTHEFENINWLTNVDLDNTISKAKHLLLVPQSKDWLLVHSITDTDIGIYLHGARSLNCQNFQFKY